MNCNMLKHSYVWVSQERAGVAALERKGSTVMIKLYFKRGGETNQPNEKRQVKSHQSPEDGMQQSDIVCILVTLCVHRFLSLYKSVIPHVHPLLGVSAHCAGSQLDCVSRHCSSKAVYI